MICHPHPLHGGTMDNKVVVTLARAFHETGIATLRFNFRGVGSSAGIYDHGNGETADAEAVASYGALRWPGRHLLLAGFSFGAFVALRLALERGASRLITVAPPVDRMDFSALAAPRCPWLVVQGDSDEVVDPKRVFAWVKNCNPQPKLVDHARRRALLSRASALAAGCGNRCHPERLNPSNRPGRWSISSPFP